MINLDITHYLEPYISAYYEVDAKEKARKLYKDVSKKYQENLTYYSSLAIENQTTSYLEKLLLILNVIKA